MNDLLSFIGMAGYAIYVWPSYLLSLVVLGGVLLVSIRARRQSERTLAALRASSRRRGDAS